MNQPPPKKETKTVNLALQGGGAHGAFAWGVLDKLLEGSSSKHIARDLGIRANMLGRWRRELSADAEKAFQGQGKARDEEMVRLKRELAQVKKERDFLKEAAAFFAKASK